MPTDQEYYKQIRTETLAQIAALRAQEKPSTSNGGEWTLWDKYINSLQETVDWCDRKLAGLDPVEVQSQAYTD